VQYFESRMIEVAEEMNAVSFRFPALISPRYLERVQYFKNFPHSLSFVSHLRENLPDIQRFMDQASVSDDGAVFAPPEGYSQPSAMLSPTVCHHLYLALSESELPESGLVATASGHCFRYESINMVSLERVWNFTMREIIFVGTDNQVHDHINAVREAMRPLLEDLELSYKVVTANDPFFIGTFRDMTAYQAAFELKFEIRADLPYKSETVAIGSYNRHGDFFGRTLNIRMPDGSPACTGCLAIGFERLALAFVTQHGIDPDRWPEKIREFSGSRPKSFRITPLQGGDCNWC
jgi:seryl-tRNA synthetase